MNKNKILTKVKDTYRSDTSSKQLQKEWSSLFQQIAKLDDLERIRLFGFIESYCVWRWILNQEKSGDLFVEYKTFVEKKT